ncbi:hypothetical protein VOM14_27960 [Paraburkholderia sp. MPAMCS5]|uniref:hypothetical protein n=1 Tax=Paraburkholderia sp. MPAMCS5 TaxID=3112563 RepID=UPI002E181BEC|nr:hypothetical protein [Paraburkholderia sp. MPAMCS5]
MRTRAKAMGDGTSWAKLDSTYVWNARRPNATLTPVTSEVVLAGDQQRIIGQALASA